MIKQKNIGVDCPMCKLPLNTWDERCSKALGYKEYAACETCLCKEYGKTEDEFRRIMESHFGMRPCMGI